MSLYLGEILDVNEAPDALKFDYPRDLLLICVFELKNCVSAIVLLVAHSEGVSDCVEEARLQVIHLNRERIVGSRVHVFLESEE